MLDLRTIFPKGDIKERYTEHEWEDWLDMYIGSIHFQALLVRFAEVEHLLIYRPVWRNVTYTCIDRLVQGIRDGHIKFVPANQDRIGCAKCGDIRYVHGASPTYVPRDYLKMRCRCCSDFDCSVTPTMGALYMQFGGLLNAD